MQVDEKQRAQFERLKAVWEKLQSVFLAAQLHRVTDEWGPASRDICGELRSLNGEFHRDAKTGNVANRALYALSLRLLSTRQVMHGAVTYGDDVEDMLFTLHEEIEERVKAVEAKDYELRWEV